MPMIAVIEKYNLRDRLDFILTSGLFRTLTYKDYNGPEIMISWRPDCNGNIYQLSNISSKDKIKWLEVIADYYPNIYLDGFMYNENKTEALIYHVSNGSVEIKKSIKGPEATEIIKKLEKKIEQLKTSKTKVPNETSFNIRYS